MQSTDQPGIETLRRFRTLSQFSNSQLRKLSDNLVVIFGTKKGTPDCPRLRRAFQSVSTGWHDHDNCRRWLEKDNRKSGGW